MTYSPARPAVMNAPCWAFAELVRAGVETQALFILNRRNVHELQAYTELTHSLGVRTAGILRLYPGSDA